MKYTDQQKTDWVIAKSLEYGFNVRRRGPAPNGGEVIVFDMPSDVDNGRRNPYWMIWTGNGSDEYCWHLEFGRHYFPKNNKERRAYPTTEYYAADEIEAAMARYVQEIREEAQQ